MSSYLDSQRAAFKGALSSAASKISKPVPKAPNSPSPSVTSTTSRNEPAAAGTATPPPKRKRQDNVVYSQPEITGFGDQIRTQIIFASAYLRDKNEPKTLDEILGHLSLVKQPDSYKEGFADLLRRNPQVDFLRDPDLTEQKWNVGKYAYRPAIPGVKDKVSLLKYLQNRKDTRGLSVKELKDGWPDCEPVLAEMEMEHKILVIRTKKEGTAKHVYLDDPSLFQDIDVEFKTMWLKTRVPSADELPRKLTAVGQKPASDDPLAARAAAAQKGKPQKRRAGKRIGKVTNTHMEGVLKDFSNLKR